MLWLKIQISYHGWRPLLPNTAKFEEIFCWIGGKKIQETNRYLQQFGLRPSNTPDNDSEALEEILHKIISFVSFSFSNYVKSTNNYYNLQKNLL